jgi:hypothetical protein
MPAFVVTAIGTGDYDSWRALFEEDVPRAREHATGVCVLRAADEPDRVLVLLEFASLDDAREARARLVGSGVLDRFPDVEGPTVLEDA